MDSQLMAKEDLNQVRRRAAIIIIYYFHKHAFSMINSPIIIRTTLLVDGLFGGCESEVC